MFGLNCLWCDTCGWWSWCCFGVVVDWWVCGLIGSGLFSRVMVSDYVGCCLRVVCGFGFCFKVDDFMFNSVGI